MEEGVGPPQLNAWLRTPRGRHLTGGLRQVAKCTLLALVLRSLSLKWGRGMDRMAKVPSHWYFLEVSLLLVQPCSTSPGTLPCLVITLCEQQTCFQGDLFLKVQVELRWRHSAKVAGGYVHLSESLLMTIYNLGVKCPFSGEAWYSVI